MMEMRSKIYGVSFTDNDMKFGDRQENIKQLEKGQQLTIVCEEDNPFDPNAMKLYADKEKERPLGYVKRELAQDLRAQMQKGWNYKIFVEEVTGGNKQPSIHGVNIRIEASKYDE